MPAPAAVLLSVVLSTSFTQGPGRGARDSFPDQPLVFETFERTIRFENDGTGRLTVAARIFVQTEAAVHALGQLAFPYGSANERLDIDTVRVVKTGGGVVVAPADAVQDVTAPVGRVAPMYSDLRQKIVTVPGLRPGDTLEYHITWIVHTPVSPGEFWYAASFLRAAVVLDERLTIDVPRDRYVQVKTNGGPAPQVMETADRRVYRWRASNLKADTTSKAATWGQIAHGVQVTTFRSWAAVGRWYADLEREREAPTDVVRAKAMELVRGRSTLRDSMTALYDFVAQNFRYVSLSFGLGRYQPHPAADVLVNGYGDCKDKHVLLAALLSAIGVPSAPVLISTEGDVDSTVPSPQQFDHVISFVARGADTVWLDATPGLAPFGFLLHGLRNRLALVVSQDSAARLMRTPAVTPFQSFERVEVSGKMTPAGNVSTAWRFTMRGDQEVLFREVFRQLPHDQQPQLANRMLSDLDLAGRASAVEVATPTATADPFWFAFHLEQIVALEWRNRRASYRLPLAPLAVPDAYDSTNATDTLPLDIVPEATRSLSLVLPPGVGADLPVPVTLARAYGEYRSSYSIHGDTLTATRSLRFTRDRLTPDRMADWNAFRRTVKDDEQQSVTLVRTGNAPAVSAAPVAAGGEDADQLHRAGLDALNAGDAATAIRLFRRTVTLQPRHQWAWNNLGRAYVQLNRLDSAMASFRKQIEINPFDEYAYNNLGLAQWRRGDLTAAGASFAKQIEVNPLDRFAHANLGRLDLQMERDSAAVVELSKAASISADDGTIRADLGRAWLRLHQPDSAVAEFDRAVELAPSPATWNSIAYALALSGERLDRAAAYARSAVDATAARLRTVAADRIGEREAFAAAELGSYWDTLGWIEFRRGNVARAEAYVGAAWLLSYHAEVGDHLGQIYAAQGKKTLALRTYAMAVNAMVPVSVTGTRRRLQALAGGAAAAERLADSGRTWLQNQRTVPLGRMVGLDGAAEVQLLVSPGPIVERARIVGGPPGFAQLAGVLRRTRLPIAFPDSTPLRLPVQGLLTCSSLTSECTLVLVGAVARLVPEVRRR